jgi:hypothetical protein
MKPSAAALVKRSSELKNGSMDLFSMSQRAVGRGRLIVTFKDGRIRSSSRIVASAGELRATRLVAPNIIGSARILTANVCPREGEVDVWVEIDWGTDLEIHVTIMVDP